jgi:hypothetical protein
MVSAAGVFAIWFLLRADVQQMEWLSLVPKCGRRGNPLRRPKTSRSLRPDRYHCMVLLGAVPHLLPIAATGIFRSPAGSGGCAQVPGCPRRAVHSAEPQPRRRRRQDGVTPIFRTVLFTPWRTRRPTDRGCARVGKESPMELAAQGTRFAGQTHPRQPVSCKESSVASSNFSRGSVISVKAVNSDPTRLGFGFYYNEVVSVPLREV